MILTNNKKIKILTDVDIYQSAVWPIATDLTESLYPLLVICIKNKLLKYSSILKPFSDILVILRWLFKYDVIITGNIKTAQILGFIRTILRLKSPKHIVLELMLDEQKKSIKWKFKKTIQRFCFSAIDIIFVSSTHEISVYSDRLGIEPAQFRFLPFHTDIKSPTKETSHSNYIFSAGKTGRDYHTLLNAVSGLESKVIIVSDRYHAEGLQLPPNVQLMVDIPYEQYLQLLKDAYIVVVPLIKLVKSTGQVVILEAMGLGKPVIATETIGTVDYLKHGVNGLMVPVGDHQALKNAIKKLLTDRELYERLSFNGLQTVKKYHTFDAYVESILGAARELASVKKSCIR